MPRDDHATIEYQCAEISSANRLDNTFSALGSAVIRNDAGCSLSSVDVHHSRSARHAHHNDWKWMRFMARDGAPSNNADRRTKHGIAEPMAIGW